MDLDTQASVLRVAQEVGREALVVVLGSPNPDSAALYAETVTLGDPAYAGPLAGVPLGLPVYHILEPEIRQEVAPEVYQREVGMSETVLETAEIIARIRAIRQQAGA